MRLTATGLTPRRMLAFLGCVLVSVGFALLSLQFDYRWDMTEDHRLSLSVPARSVLAAMDGPVSATVYATPGQRRARSALALLEQFSAEKADLTIDLVDPNAAPAELRERGLDGNGEMVLHFQGRTQTVADHSESAVANAMARLLRDGQRWVGGLSGHGERSFGGSANHDLGEFATRLGTLGVEFSAVNLAATGKVPANTAVLVIASPQVALLPAERKAVEDYVAEGGNLLWLKEPEATVPLDWLDAELGIEPIAGTIVDPNMPLMGIDQPTIVVVSDYLQHRLTRDFELLSVLAEVTALAVLPDSNWEAAPLATTSDQAWSDTDLSSGVASFDAAVDTPGPLVVAFALERPRADPQTRGRQRVVVIGDGDFLSNSYLGNGGNYELGAIIISWLSSDDTLIDVPVREATDRIVMLSREDAALIGFVVLFGVPGVLAFTGAVMWWRRCRY